MTAFVSTDISVTNGSTTITVNDNVDFSQVSTSSVLFINNNSPVIVDAGTAPDTPTSGASQLTLRTAWSDATVTNGEALLLVGMNALVDAITKANDSGTILANMTAAQADLYTTTNAAYPIQVSSSQSVNVPTWPYLESQFINGIFTTLTSTGNATFSGIVGANRPDSFSSGIGSGVPQLEVVNTDATNNNWARISFGDLIGGASAGILGYQITDHANNYGDFAIATRGVSGFGERMRIDSTGNVGIGTASPAAVTDITGAGVGGRGLRITETSASKSNGVYTFEVDSSAHTSNTTNAGAMKVSVNSGDAMVINGAGNATFAGNVGIGATPGTNKLLVSGDGDVKFRVATTGGGASDDAIIVVATSNDSASSYLDFGDGSDSNAGSIRYNHSSDSMRFTTNTVEAFTLDSSQNATFAGNVGIGGAPLSNVDLYVTGSATDDAVRILQNTSSNITHVAFINSNGTVGSIKTSGTATSYNTSSDPRLKDFLLIQDVLTERGFDDYDSMINADFNDLYDSSRWFKFKGEDRVIHGFDAHACIDAGLDMGTEGTGPRDLAIGDVYETEEIPEVTEEKEILDEDGNGTGEFETVITQEAKTVEHKVTSAGVDQSKAVPILLAKIEQLERRLQALEA